MPIVKVYGIPFAHERGWKITMDDFIFRIKKAVASVTGLGVTAKDVSVVLVSSYSNDLIAEVCGVFEKPERTLDVLADLTAVIANELRMIAKSYLPYCGYVEAVISTPINPSTCTGIRLSD